MPTSTSPIWVTIHHSGTGRKLTCRADSICEVIEDADLFSDASNEMRYAIGCLQVAVERGEPCAEYESFLGIRVAPASGPFLGTQRGNDVHVDIWCYQNADGAVIDGRVDIRSEGNWLHAVTARKVAADLLAAADELDALDC